MNITDDEILPVERLNAGPGVVAATTWRGDSINAADNYSGFSLCHYTGDAPDHYESCRRRLARWCGVSQEFIIVPRQTHSTDVTVISDPSAVVENTDAVITALPGIVIGINTADCVPVLLNDSAKRIIGAVHAGWRGAIGGIVGEAVKAMISLGSDPGDIYATMGPCIGVECFEVGEEVAMLFPQECVTRTSGQRPHIDLAKYITGQLVTAGVPAAHISQPPACTRCNPEHYFSARAHGIASGRNFTFIMLTLMQR